MARNHVSPSTHRKLDALKMRVQEPSFGRKYALFSLAILLITTVLWATLGAILQGSNADQLVNAYLFENSQTFGGAQLPAQHSFLLKWPLFLLIKFIGYSSASYVLVTLLAVLLTVFGLAAVIYRIERRPLVFGTLILALSSVLLLVPVQSYAGALLPVNMAMITTRNLEYVLYILSVYLVARSPLWKSPVKVLGIVVLVLLMASDHLFMSLAVGSASIYLVYGLLSKRRPIIRQAQHWLVCALIAVVVTMLITYLLRPLGVLHITGNEAAGPYGLTHSSKDMLLGILYGVLGIATNAGANPAFSAREVAKIPSTFFTNLVGFGLLGYITNYLIVLSGVAVVLKARNKNSHDQYLQETPVDYTAHVLVASVLTALGAYVVTDHYYAVDARYLGIVPFALFISLAVRVRTKNWRPFSLLIIGGVLLLASILSSLTVIQQYATNRAVLRPYDQRTHRVVQALQRHQTTEIVGDYWRVLPVKQKSKSTVAVEPLQNCTTPRTVLTSKAWQPNLKDKRFAYLLSFDRGLTDYPKCDLRQILNTYGMPNSTTLIAGKVSDPKEMLLFYDSGAHQIPLNQQLATAEPSLLPIDLSALENTTCDAPTQMNIVAHQDDDLLFMSPDLIDSLRGGNCVRTIYVTAGDSGGKESYWLAREQGSQAAYAAMLGIPDVWNQRVVKIADNEYVTVATPRDLPKISLIFLRLPDGNLDGRGFPATHQQSLAKLEKGSKKHILSVDRQSRYTSGELKEALARLMQRYQPSGLRTQGETQSVAYPDHSDHRAVGHYVAAAYANYVEHEHNQFIPIRYYQGYPVRDQPTNVSGTQLLIKQAAFLAYAKYDGSVCRTASQCSKTDTYGSYLTRQYPIDK